MSATSLNCVIALHLCEYGKTYHLSTRQGEKFSAQPKTDVKLRTSDRLVGTRAGAGVTFTLV